MEPCTKRPAVSDEARTCTRKAFEDSVHTIVGRTKHFRCVRYDDITHYPSEVRERQVMRCEERIRELEEQIRELKEAWEADIEHYEERIRDLEEDCHQLRIERDEWYDRAEEWKQRAYDYENERNEALERVRELEEELERIKPKYEALLSIFQEELGHLETLISAADWEHAAKQVEHIRRRYHASIAMHALQNPDTITNPHSDTSGDTSY